MIAAARVAAPGQVESLRSTALRAIRAYRRALRAANTWERRLRDGSLPPSEVDADCEDALARLHETEGAAVDALESYAKAVRQRGPHPFVVDSRGDTIAYIEATQRDWSIDFQDVFTTIRTGLRR